MPFISMSSIYSPYHNRSSDVDGEVSQPLLGATQTSGLAVMRNRCWPYIARVGQVDSKGYISCIFSTISSTAAIVTFFLHALEKYHENHKEILTAEAINISAMALWYMRKVFFCFSFSLSLSKNAAEQIQLNDLSEQSVAADDSSITKQSVDYSVLAAQWLKKLNARDYLYYGVNIGSIMTAGGGFYFHVTEKEHENHTLMLWLEGFCVFFSIFLTTMVFKKTTARNRVLQNLLPENSTEIA